jgi:hypothetical protein
MQQRTPQSPAGNWRRAEMTTASVYSPFGCDLARPLLDYDVVMAGGSHLVMDEGRTVSTLVDDHHYPEIMTRLVTPQASDG